MTFSTGDGVVDSGQVIGLDGLMFGPSASHLLDNCPSVKLLGEIVETKCMPFVWVRGELPMFLRDSSHLQYVG